MTKIVLLLPFILLLSLIVLVGLGFLQSKLVKRENEAIGLILPTVFFVISVVLLLSLGVLNNETDSFAEYIGGITVWFVILNIPTMVFTIIFSVHSKKQNGKKEIEKMNIMDLE